MTGAAENTECGGPTAAEAVEWAAEHMRRVWELPPLPKNAAERCRRDPAGVVTEALPLASTEGMIRADERLKNVVWRSVETLRIGAVFELGKLDSEGRLVEPEGETAAEWRTRVAANGTAVSERWQHAGLTPDPGEPRFLTALVKAAPDTAASLAEPAMLEGVCRLLWAILAPPDMHPLPLLLAAWAVAQVEPNRHERPILSGLRISESPERERGRFGGLVPDGRSDDAQLPLFGAERRPGGVIDRVPLLGIADAATGGAVTARGRGAPLELALPVTAMLAVSPDDRRRMVEIAVSIRELRDALWPHGWERRRDWPRLQRELQALDRRFIPWGDGGKWWPVKLHGLPGLDADLGELVVLGVKLPPGAHQGTPIDRRRLSELRVDAGGSYRSLIAATALAWQPGKTRVRTSDGRMVWSSDPSRYPVLTRQDRSEVVFGAGGQGHRTSAEVDGPFERLAEAGDIIIADRSALDPDTHSQGWRIVPAEAATDKLRARVADERTESEARPR